MMLMRFNDILRARSTAGVLLGALLLSACGGSSQNVRPVTADEKLNADDEPMASVKEYHRYHHHGGVTLFIAMSLDTLGVSPDRQAAVERIRTQLHSQMEPARVAEQSLVSTLADGLAAGTLDPAKVDAALIQVRVANAAVYDASVSALNELHNLLTPPERAVLVDKVSSHWAVWQKANDDPESATENDGHLATLAVDLDLTSDQVRKIRAALGVGASAVPRLDPLAIGARLHAFGDAFESDSFDAKKLTTVNDANALVAGWGAGHMAHFVEATLLVLTADQRAELAQHLRSHASHGLASGGAL
jgi:Spy/CpxP family protein refolding chaperone